MTPEEKKKRERRFVEDIAGRLDWPIRNLVDRERPDFRMDLNDGTVVGLEVVETLTATPQLLSTGLMISVTRSRNS